MKTLLNYINEALKVDVQKWIKNVYQTQQSLIKDNKIQPIKVDPNNLKKPKKSFIYDEYASDTIFKNIVSDKHVGFTVTGQMLRNVNQYLKDDDKEFQPECYPYWYQEGENVYFVGLVMYDKNVSYIDDYFHLVNIEASLIVEESLPVLKGILKDFIKIVNKEGNYSGISAKPTHPKLKATLIKLGFNSTKENKEVLFYKI